MDVPSISETCNDFLQKLGIEIASARPASDQGQLPILDLLSNLRDLCSQAEATKPAVPIVQEAYLLIESIVEAGRNFTKADLEKFQALHVKMAESLGQPSTVVFPNLSQFSSEPEIPKVEESSNSKEEETAITLNLSSDAELLREFINESYERLGDIERDVLVLEDKPEDLQTINSLFRSFHTFKGGSGFLNLTPMHQLAHRLESLLDLVRNHKIGMDAQIIDLILSGKDLLQYFVMEIEMQLKGVRTAAPISISIQPLLREVQRVIDTAKLTGNEKTATSEGNLSSNQSEYPGLALAENASTAKTETSTIKVDISKLDDLMDLVGELVISQSLISQHALKTADENTLIKDNLVRLFRITKELQKTAMSMRMIPIRGTFQKMNRMVRNLSSKLGKRVQLHITGEETELDRTIVEEVGDPLMHMISNAIDHGIEKPEERVAAGKPEFGSLSLHAFHQGGSTVIQIKDDGGGLKKDLILQKAREKGLVKEHEVLQDREIYHLIFQPGFSTAEVVTDISGRGVGMDVVRQNIEKLRGRIDINSQEGVGTTFTISLPLTLAIIEGFIVSVGTQRFILPAQSIVKSFRITRDIVSTLHERGEMVDVRGRQVPILRLHEFLEIPARCTDPAGGIGVLVKAEGHERCILVDGLIGKQEVVIKGLGDLFKTNQLLTGGAIMGDGSVGLILDVASLVRLGPQLNHRKVA